MLQCQQTPIRFHNTCDKNFTMHAKQVYIVLFCKYNCSFSSIGDAKYKRKVKKNVRDFRHDLLQWFPMKQPK